jgi:hypothetical protein
MFSDDDVVQPALTPQMTPPLTQGWQACCLGQPAERSGVANG